MDGNTGKGVLGRRRCESRCGVFLVPFQGRSGCAIRLCRVLCTSIDEGTAEFPVKLLAVPIHRIKVLAVHTTRGSNNTIAQTSAPEHAALDILNVN